MGVSNKLDTAVGMGLATTFVLTLSAMSSWILEHFVLVPLGIGYLRIISFILAPASISLGYLITKGILSDSS